MSASTKYQLNPKARDSYLELVKAFPLISIQSDEHMKAAQQVIDQILIGGKLSRGESMYLDALSDLVASYETQHYHLAPASDADMLRHFLDARGISQSQLSREANIAKSTISEILSGRKQFSRQIIRKLAEYFGVDVSLLAGNL